MCGDHISFRRWEKQSAQSQTAPFPPITAPRGTQQRNFPYAHAGSSTTRELPTGSPPHYRQEVKVVGRLGVRGEHALASPRGAARVAAVWDTVADSAIYSG